MSAACPFCELVAGRAPASIIRSWDDAIAIRPLNPVTDGHLLVIPREHVESFFSSPNVSAATMRRAASLGHGMESWEPFGEDANIITSIGPLATQTIKHLHVHVVPRRADDGLLLPWSGRDEIERLREGWTRSDEDFDRFLDSYAALFSWEGDLTPQSVLAHASRLARRPESVGSDPPA